MLLFYVVCTIGRKHMSLGVKAFEYNRGIHRFSLKGPYVNKKPSLFS